MKISELFFPTKFTCFCCDRELPEGNIICDDCFSKLKIIPKEKACVKCGRLMQGEAKICDKCLKYNPKIERNYGVFMYDEFVSSLIYKFKFGKAKYIANSLASYLFFKYKEIDEQIDLITFVPKIDDNKRGTFNGSKILATKLCQMANKPLFDKVTKRIKTKEQKKLDYASRQSNLSGSFSVDERVKGKNILIVDDIITSGATTAEIRKEFMKKGANKVISLTLAID